MDTFKLATRIHDHLEEGNLEGSVMACLRLARATRDHLSTIIFLRELYPDKNEVARVLYDETSQLKSEAQEFIWKVSLQRWLELHTIDDPAVAPSSDSEGNKPVLKIAVGEIDPEIKQLEASLSAYQAPQGMTPFDTAAFTAAQNQQKGIMQFRLRALNAIKSRLRTRCLNYAVQVERQMSMQERDQSFVWSAQNSVHNFFKGRDESIFQKLQKAAQLSALSDAEDASLLLTEVRRILKSVADHFFPASSEELICSDGRRRVLGEEQYMNRLEEFLRGKLSRSTARELALAELEVLATFMRRLNDLASKGVHADVRPAEARQGLLGLYLFLFNISQNLVIDAKAEPT